jgi:hypothetical protein
VHSFGAQPTKNYGVVPKFALTDPNVPRGAKLLYALLCTFASQDGIVWRSLDKVAQELCLSKRQVQRAANDLEASGLVVRIGFHGRCVKFQVIRQIEGISWAKSKNLGNVINRRGAFAAHGKRGAEARYDRKNTATLVSPMNDTHVPERATPMSPEHNLTNKTTLTNQAARQESKKGSQSTIAKTALGINRLNRDPEGAEVNEALCRLAQNVGGWEAIAKIPPAELAALLKSHFELSFSPSQIRSCLAGPLPNP